MTRSAALNRRREIQERAGADPDFYTNVEESPMFLITSRETRATINPEAQEAERTVSTSARIEMSIHAARGLLQMRQAGDDAARSVRVFPVLVDEEGEPTIGEEVNAIDPPPGEE